MKSVFKAIALVTIFSFITRLLGFFFRVFLSRKLGAEGLGLYQMATSIITIFMTLIASGLPLTTAKLVSKYESQNNYLKRNKAVSSSLIIGLVVALICSILILILQPFWHIIIPDNRVVSLILILIPSIIFSAIYAVFHGTLWGQNDYFNCGLTELIEQIIRFILTAILLFKTTNSFLATKNTAIAFNIACLISAIITMILYFKKGKFNFKKGEYLNILKSAAPITGVRLSNSLVQPLTSLIIPTMLIFAGYSQAEAIGSYGVVMGMTFPMLFVPMTFVGSISMVLIPTISSMMTNNKFADVENNITSTVNISTFISMIFIPLYLSVGDLIGVILYNNAMSGVMLQLSALCVLPITLCNLSGSVLNALNLESKSLINYLIGSATLIALLVILTPLIGINSIAVSYFVSMALITLLNLRKINKTLPNLKLNLFSHLFKYILIVAPSSVLGYFISNICNHLFSNIFSALLGGGISIISVIVLCKLFNIFDIKTLLDLLLKKHKKKTSP